VLKLKKNNSGAKRLKIVLTYNIEFSLVKVCIHFLADPVQSIVDIVGVLVWRGLKYMYIPTCFGGRRCHQQGKFTS